MVKLMSFLLVLVFTTVAIADVEVPLPGPGSPPSEPPPPQPTRTPLPTPTPPPYEPPPPYPTPTPYPGNPPEQDTTYTLGSGQVGRLKEKTFTFQPPPHLRNIRALRLTCTNEKIKIKSVLVTFRSGQTASQSILEGLYRIGDSHISFMYSAPVASVTVVAASSSVFRTNGAFRLDAAASPKNARDEESNNEAF